MLLHSIAEISGVESFCMEELLSLWNSLLSGADKVVKKEVICSFSLFQFHSESQE